MQKDVINFDAVVLLKVDTSRLDIEVLLMMNVSKVELKRREPRVADAIGGRHQCG